MEEKRKGVKSPLLHDKYKFRQISHIALMACLKSYKMCNFSMLCKNYILTEQQRYMPLFA